MNTFLVNASGLILIALILWWFIFKKPKATRITNNTIDIKVHNGVYDPPVIRAKKGTPLHLRFLRQDDSPCSAIVIFARLNISTELPHNKIQEISITINEAGAYEFTCQMGMYRGTLIVE